VSESESIGVFGEELILWVCILRQSPRRPQADHVYRQANFLLDELRQSQPAQLLPIVSAEDGMFAIAALIVEVAMALPDLRPWWSQNMLQARRFNTNNAGVEFYQRLDRVRQGSKSVLATYVVVLGCGFLGQYGLPGRDPYLLNQLRAQLARELGVDADRDVMAGAIKAYRYDAMPAEFLPKEPLWKTVWVGRALAVLLLFIGGSLLGYALDAYMRLKS
jgi:type VI secretion system protein ImpK